MRAFWNYYFTINVVNVLASIIIAIMNGPVWLPLSLCSFGPGIGLLAYYIFYKDQYYFYYNLGYTKKRLALMVFACNAIIALPLLLIYLILQS